jgi:hypothetical protein
MAYETFEFLVEIPALQLSDLKKMFPTKEIEG